MPLDCRRCRCLGSVRSLALASFFSPPMPANDRKCRRVSGATGSEAAERLTMALRRGDGLGHAGNTQRAVPSASPWVGGWGRLMQAPKVCRVHEGSFPKLFLNWAL